MALQSQIEAADRARSSAPGGAQFTDLAVLPETLAECAIPSEEVAFLLRMIDRGVTDEIARMVLLSQLLGE